MTTVWNVQSVSMPLDELTGDNVIRAILKAPSASNGGGLKVLGAVYFAGAATNSGTAHSLTLLKYNSNGTLAGTVSATLGGTANPFSANSFNAFTITDGDLSADQYLVVRKNQTNTSNPERSVLMVEYIHARS